MPEASKSTTCKGGGVEHAHIRRKPTTSYNNNNMNKHEINDYDINEHNGNNDTHDHNKNNDNLNSSNNNSKTNNICLRLSARAPKASVICSTPTAAFFDAWLARQSSPLTAPVLLQSTLKNHSWPS
jgi:hypothetical protein